MEPSLIETGRSRAQSVLLANGGELGLVAAGKAYQQVWARDSMICGLGLLLCGGENGRGIQRRSLETLREYQSELGKVPHNVGLPGIIDPALIAHGGQLGSEATGTALEAGAVRPGSSESGGGNAGPGDTRTAARPGVTDTAHAGCLDDNLWYIVGHGTHFRSTGDLAFLEQSWPSLERALLWLRYQDSNECGLLEAHEAMDWADLFANRYNVLYDNVLWYAAWRSMGEMATALGRDPERYRLQAAEVHRKVNSLLWVGPEEPKDWEVLASERKEWLYPLRRIETELVERPFYLPYVAFRDYADRFDTLGNLLAILFGVADGSKSAKILDYLQGCGLNEPNPVRSVYPPVQSGDRDWREYYRVRNLNLPHHYHNGGAWPFIGGFYVAALVQAGRLEEAGFQLERLAQMNRRGRWGEWEFNEWFHGESGRPMGYAHQSWSAAMFLFACRAVEEGQVPLLSGRAGTPAAIGAAL